jgi:hypothetical protein
MIVEGRTPIPVCWLACALLPDRSVPALEAPPGVATRPTSDRLRETLFNVLAPRIEGAAFLDLYAGSGAVGMEALSRGAAQVEFVERAPAALKVLRGNLERLGITAGFRIHACRCREHFCAAPQFQSPKATKNQNATKQFENGTKYSFWTRPGMRGGVRGHAWPAGRLRLPGCSARMRGHRRAPAQRTP